MKSYVSARSFIGYMETIGWLIVAFSVAVFFYDMEQDARSALFLASPILIAGLAMVTAVQIARAQIDTAENTGRILELLKADILGTPYSGEADTDARAAPPTPAKTTAVQTYRGQPITQVPGGYIALGKQYTGVIAAENAIDRALDAK